MNDEMTILLAKEGNRDAFRSLYDSHRERIYRLAFRYVRSVEDAEDVMQESFIKAFKGLRTFKFGMTASFSAWLSKICIRCAIDHLHKAKKRRSKGHLSLNGLVREPRSEEPSPDRTVEAVRTLAWIQDALRLLSPNQQVIFDLRHRQHLDVKEIAARMGCSESNIKTQLSRSVKKLRELLEPVWGEP